MADVGRVSQTPGLGERPALSALAFAAQTPWGFLSIAFLVAYLGGSDAAAIGAGALMLIPGITTIVRTCIRIRRLERLAGIDPTSGWLMGIVWVLIGAGGPFLMQNGLNRAWYALWPDEDQPD
jgi:hypothetical protein